MSNVISGNVQTAGASIFCVSVPRQGSDGIGVSLYTSSDLAGNYSFSGLLSGVYRITVTLAGYSFGPSRIVTINPLFETASGILTTGPAVGTARVWYPVVPSDVTNLNFFPVMLGGVGPLPPTPVSLRLGTASNYALLSAAGITNSGATLITGGNIGSYPTTSITGFSSPNFTPPATTDNADAQVGLADAAIAYTYYSGLAFTSLSASSANLSALGNQGNAGTYFPGNYSAGSTMDIPTSITLDGQGNANAVFVFKAGSTLTLESGASILLANSAQAKNIVWIVGSSLTTVGTTGVFNGNALINTSATLGGGTVNGRILAGVVTSSGAITIATATAVNVPS